MRVLLACDRSGGHFFPAFSLANYLDKDEVYFFIPSHYFSNFLKIRGWKVLGKPLNFRNLLLEGTFRVCEALYVIFKVRPKKVIGFGGRDTFSLIVIASLFFIYTAIYEPNVVKGKANKYLSLIVRKVYCGFNQTFKSSKAIKVGVPLREDLKIWDKKEAKDKLGLFNDLAVILCFGGSQGAIFINQLVKWLINNVKRDFQIIHIVGSKQFNEFINFYDKIKIKAKIFEFCLNMDLVYSATDIVISRAGILSLVEISWFGIPAILIPHPGASRHQSANAYYLQERKACFVFEQDNFNYQNFKNTLEKLLDDVSLRRNISHNIKSLSLAVSSDQFYKNLEL
ncbi:MAG: UDP-N-acetylglucosamine--N-acetylmuramyl-(pentapeptide) pyrophosphoryl-undecaprenol N-acetylglucosamine transferase [Candidatus Omnitrophica bacterium]|nr:UDP-N-acetylglucosamine--N-acetylmuramyl-(pentapeptide) pyrophosphoryl-undecaprenol N-acetylglucosamine transferase [Candidatus Omnitrophota bacterium]